MIAAGIGQGSNSSARMRPGSYSSKIGVGGGRIILGELLQECPDILDVEAKVTGTGVAELGKHWLAAYRGSVEQLELDVRAGNAQEHDPFAAAKGAIPDYCKAEKIPVEPQRVV
jgi:hypothetical protein